MYTQFALVVIFSIAVSLLDATTVVPMLSSRLIQGDAHHENLADGHQRNMIERLFFRFGQWFDALDSSYRNGLRWAIHHRVLVIAGVTAVSAASFILWPKVGTELMPPTDSGDISIDVKMPIGTSLEKTDETMRQVEGVLLKNPNVNTVFTAAGTRLNLRGASTSLTPSSGSAMVKLKEDRRDSTQDVIRGLQREFSKLPGARAMPRANDVVTFIMTGGPQNVEVDIFGNDLTMLSNISKDVMGRMRGIRGLENLDVNWQDASPELQWKVDRQKSSQFGLSFEDVATTINTATNGTIASYYQEAGFQYPIIVQLPEAQRKTTAELANLSVSPSLAGAAYRDIQLRQVAHAVESTGPNQITRLDRQRYIAVTGVPLGRSEGDVQADIEKSLTGLKLPVGYTWDWGSSQKRRADEFAGMGLAVALAVCLIYMLLASQFESFIHPLTILTSVPLSAVGVILALFLTGRAFGLTAFIGLLMLVGIVVKNGILLVDYTNVLRGRGYARDDAILTAGPTRLRPILMTTCAAILGMLPLAIGMGRGSETQAPMATAVIGGLMTSSMLTLFIVPTVYTIFDDLARMLRRDKRDLAAAEKVTPTVEAIERQPDAAPAQPAPKTPEPVE
jgi:HAE1 family hydrophobic/amphiphilic exporter-1